MMKYGSESFITRKYLIIRKYFDSNTYMKQNNPPIAETRVIL